MARQPRVNYNEDHMWGKAVQKAMNERKQIEKEKKKRRRKPKVKLKRDIAKLRRPREVIDLTADEPADPLMPWEQDGWDPSAGAGEDWNRALDAPQQRVERIMTAGKAKRPQPVYRQIPMSKLQRNLLFMNPGDEKIMEATVALSRGGPIPEWTTQFRRNLHVKGARAAMDDREDEKIGEVHDGGPTLYFRDNRIDLPFAMKDEKRDAVKALYFNPKEPSTIQPITDELRKHFCNVSKSNVTHILRSLETYQRNFARRLPPKIASRTLLRQPGILAVDMFFPSAQLGWWGKFSCLTCMDTWSRFCRVYALEHKDYESTKRAMQSFLQEFSSFGFLPRRILADKGTDLAPAKELMERYRQHRDQNADMVLHSKTGQPVLIVEALNAQVQRRMQIFRTANLTDDPSTILEDITDQINNQKRPDRGNLTPLQLLGLNGAERAQVNEAHRDRTFRGLETGLKALKVGNTVRYLKWDRKEQVKGGLGAKYKGFAPKWSHRTYTVLKRTGMRRSPGVYTYHIGRDQMFYRHELLKIPRVVDREVPRGFMHHKQHVTVPENEEWDQFDDIPSEDSY